MSAWIFHLRWVHVIFYHVYSIFWVFCTMVFEAMIFLKCKTFITFHQILPMLQILFFLVLLLMRRHHRGVHLFILLSGGLTCFPSLLLKVYLLLKFLCMCITDSKAFSWLSGCLKIHINCLSTSTMIRHKVLLYSIVCRHLFSSFWCGKAGIFCHLGKYVFLLKIND